MTHLAGSSKLLRAMNDSAALAHLLERGELTRNKLRELTGLSKPTVSETLRRLTEVGLATVVGHVSAGPGPNAEVYGANRDAAYTVVVSVRDVPDANRPTVAAAVCDLAGTVRGRLDSTIDFTRADPVDAIVGVVDRLCRDAGLDPARIAHLHLGVPGAYDVRAGVIHHVEVPALGRPGLVDEVRKRLATTVDVDNDVNLAAIAERRRGAARDVDGFALLWLGEGLGLAIDLGGTLLRGAHGSAGEIGYMPMFVPADRNERRSAKTALQDLIGGPAVLALAERYGLPGRTPAEVLAAAAAATHVEAAADPARGFLEELADRIAVGLAAIVAVLDPPLVVLAGDAAQAGGETLCAAVRAAMRHRAPLETTVALTAIDDDPVLLGGLAAGLTATQKALIASVHAARN